MDDVWDLCHDPPINGGVYDMNAHPVTIEEIQKKTMDERRAIAQAIVRGELEVGKI